MGAAHLLQQPVGLPAMPVHSWALPEVLACAELPICLQCTAVRLDLNICSAYAK